MEVAQIERGYARRQGDRDHQEDQFCISDQTYADKGYALYSVFDGHGTDAYSKHSKDNMHSYILESPEFGGGDYGRALFQGFLQENQAMKDILEQRGEGRGGTTATVALVVDKHRLFVANVGDSRSVLARDEGSGLVPIRMSRDHNLKDPKEYERIAQLGVPAKGNRVYAPGHSLNMTRALGDFDFKAPYNQEKHDTVSAEPTVHSIDLSPQDKFLILASDGLWDQYSDQQALEEVARLRIGRCASGQRRRGMRTTPR
jgi:serine/threonine protein phosphatase PrpC